MKPIFYDRRARLLSKRFALHQPKVLKKYPKSKHTARSTQIFTPYFLGPIEDCSSISPDILSVGQTLAGREISEKTISWDGIKYIIFYRTESKGDVGSIEQCLVNRQYNVRWLPQAKRLTSLYNEIIRSGRTPLIIDAGANIGVSCQWFHGIYPRAKILAIEPDRDNCKLLMKNCAGLPVYLYNGALADKKRILKFYDPGESDWGFRVGLNGSRDVNCVGPMDIMSWCDKQLYIPLILKIDIEGSEKLLFEGDCQWLLKIPMFIVELHDWLFPEGDTSRNFVKAIAQFDIQLYTRGENIFCFNKVLL